MYDSECLYLAQAFLRDHPEIDSEKTQKELAQRIQEVIDDYIEEKEEDNENAISSSLAAFCGLRRVGRFDTN
jgi:predicted RNase H-like HicB family nuclease